MAEDNLAKSYIEWAIDRIDNHPVTKYASPVRCVELSMDLARLAVQLHIALAESIARQVYNPRNI